MSETQPCPEAVSPPERCSQKQTHHFFALMMTPREAGSRGTGNLGKGKKSEGAGRVSESPFLAAPCHLLEQRLDFRKQKPKLICNEGLLFAGSGRKTKSIHFIALGLD